MRLEVRVGGPETVEIPLLALPWCQIGGPGEADDGEEAGPEPRPDALEALDEGLGGLLGRAIEGGDFRGKRGETLLLYGREGAGPARVLLVGVGRRGDLSAERLREAAARAVSVGGSVGATEIGVRITSEWLDGAVGIEPASRAVSEGLELAAWRFEEFRSEPSAETGRVEAGTLLLDDAGDEEAASRGAGVGRTLAGAQNYARELSVRPANVATPGYLADEAVKLGDELGLEVTILDRAAMETEGMRTLLGVAAGSDEEPRFIVMEHRLDAGSRPLVLVGKGVTFDSGGLSLKTSSGMETMKYDKSGATAVLGAMRAIAELDVPVPVVGLIPAVENLPSGHALRPGDVIRSHSGKTVEVLNTDAEGRLILADALSYAARYEPEAMVDVATLTGACVVALGHHAIGLMGNDEALVEEIREVGQRSGERVWPLPLWSEYRDQLDSEIADIKNTGGRPAGTITAGLFLKEFVGSTSWAHLDIAGTAWAEKSGPYQPKGPTGVGVRLLAEWVRGRAD